jgi:NADH-quinone oxidoreductase subunit L
MREMGGLRKVMPWTFVLFVIGSLSLAGIWPLAGFWSKDEILASALEHQPALFALALITVFMTAFYMFRVVFLTFGGESRAVTEHGHSEKHGHSHESPGVMVIPMIILGILAVISGFWGVTGHFNLFITGSGETQSFVSGFFGVFAHSLPWISLIVALLGIFLAYAIYSARWIPVERVVDMFKPAHTILSNKYWLDELYEKIIVGLALLGGLFAWFQRIDTRAVDGAANGVADVTIGGGKVARRMQTGQLQLYALTIGLGLVAIIICVLAFGR